MAKLTKKNRVKNIIILFIDLLFIGFYSMIGLFFFILYGFMGPEGDFTNVNKFFRNLALPILICIQIIFGIILSIFFFKKERTKYKIKINRLIMIINIVIILFPYLIFIREILF